MCCVVVLTLLVLDTGTDASKRMRDRNGRVFEYGLPHREGQKRARYFFVFTRWKTFLNKKSPAVNKIL